MTLEEAATNCAANLHTEHVNHVQIVNKPGGGKVGWLVGWLLNVPATG